MVKGLVEIYVKTHKSESPDESEIWGQFKVKFKTFKDNTNRRHKEADVVTLKRRKQRKVTRAAQRLKTYTDIWPESDWDPSITTLFSTPHMVSTDESEREEGGAKSYVTHSDMSFRSAAATDIIELIKSRSATPAADDGKSKPMSTSTPRRLGPTNRRRDPLMGTNRMRKLLMEPKLIWAINRKEILRLHGQHTPLTSKVPPEFSNESKLRHPAPACPIVPVDKPIPPARVSRYTNVAHAAWLEGGSSTCFTSPCLRLRLLS